PLALASGITNSNSKALIKAAAAFGRHIQLFQQILFKVVSKGLFSSGGFHAQQPGIALVGANGKVTVKGRNGNGAVFFRKQPRAAQPAAQKARELIGGGG